MRYAMPMTYKFPSSSRKRIKPAASPSLRSVLPAAVPREMGFHDLALPEFCRHQMDLDRSAPGWRDPSSEGPRVCACSDPVPTVHFKQHRGVGYFKEQGQITECSP